MSSWEPSSTVTATGLLESAEKKCQYLTTAASAIHLTFCIPCPQDMVNILSLMWTSNFIISSQLQIIVESKYKQCWGRGMDNNSNIMSLFNTREFEDYSHRIYLNTKKNLEATVDMEMDKEDIDPQLDISIFQVFTPEGLLNVYHEGQTMVMPNVLDLNISQLLNFVYKDLDQKDRQRLLQLVPHKDPGIVKDLLEGKDFRFGNPVEQFQSQLKAGYFSKIREREEEIQDQLCVKYMLEYFSQISQQINDKEYRQRRVGVVFSAPELSEVTSFEDLQPNYVFQESNQTETEEEMEFDADELEGELRQVFFKYEDKRKTQEELLALSDERPEYRATRTIKPMIVPTKIVRSHDWVEVYRKQQEERYRNPTKSWLYVCEDGRKVNVAPVAKKATSGVGKPREHIMLKQQRPSCVTILTLVRDAAARLPNGVGTRADICELLKQSQYVNEDIGDDKINTIVSGALDRLHYMSDACVKYDAQRKLWIYLHMERTGQVMRDDDPTDDYRQKKIYKRKKMEEADLQ